MNNSINEEKNTGASQPRQDPATEKLQNITNRGLNAATGGTWNKARNAPIIGNALKNAENGIANKLGNSRLANKLINPGQHKRPNLGVQTKDAEENQDGPKKGDKGSQKLRQSLGNKAKNLWQQRKKKKQKEKAEDPNSDNEDKNVNPEAEEETGSTEESRRPSKAKIKRRILIKVAIGVGIGLLIYVLVVMVLSVFTGGSVFVAPIVSSKSWETEDFLPITETDSKSYEDEINYYKKLKEIQDAKGDVISINYLNALLLDLYYEHDFQAENEDLAESLGIDFKAMIDYADKFAELLESLDSTDYEINGVIYNGVKESDEFKEYYKPALEEKDIDEIMVNIHELSKQLDAVDEETDDVVVTEDIKVTVNKSTNISTTPAPGSKATPVPATTVTNTKTVTINEYIADAIYANASDYNNSEIVKAYTIAYSTNLVAENKKLTVSSTNASASGPTCSTTLGCSYDKDGNLVDGPGERSNKNSNFYNGKYYYKTPLSSSAQKELTDNINSVFGNVLVNEDGTYPTLDVNKLTFFGDSDYQKALSQSYGELKTKNVGENSYILDGSYGKNIVKRNVIFYDQKNYPNSVFCGIKGYTIGGSGCGVTAMAIVASTYENNKKYDPVYMNGEARRLGMCGSGGTSRGFFSREAKAMKYNELEGSKYKKSFLNLVLKHLSQGHLVVVRMGPGHFTGGGHYMVLAGVDPTTKKVYVYDPNNKSNSSYRKTGNGWYSYNDIIVKEAYDFYIIWKG